MSHFKPFPTNSNIDFIEQAVCDIYEIPYTDIGLKTRLRTISEARAVVCFIRMKAFGESEWCCARRYNQDHSNMHYNKRRVVNLYWVDRHFRNKMDKILEELNLSDRCYSMGLEKP